MLFQRKHLIFADNITTKSITTKSFRTKIRPSSSFHVKTNISENIHQAPVATSAESGDDKKKNSRYNPIRKCFSAIGFSNSEPNLIKTSQSVITNSFKDMKSEPYDYEFKREHIRKMSSVIEFNKFKNKFCGQTLLRPIEPVSIPNIRLLRPMTESRRYFENSQGKRQSHIKFLNKRQLFLANSLSIKKL